MPGKRFHGAFGATGWVRWLRGADLQSMLTSPLLAQWKRSTVTDFSNMHEAYRKIPSFTFSFSRVMSWLVNLLFAVQRFFACRRPNPALAVSTQLIPRADSSDLQAIVMRPRDSSETLPILLYYHGGGFVFSWVSMHHQHCQRYTLEANCVTLLVDYRLGPKQPFPDGFEDCYTAYEWALQNAASLNADATRVVVMGDSAGGAFAAGRACVGARQRFLAADGGVGACIS